MKKRQQKLKRSIERPRESKRGSSLLFVVLLVMVFTVLLMDFAWITARTAGNVQKNRERLKGLAAAESIHKTLCREVSSGKSAVIKALKRKAEEEKREEQNREEKGEEEKNEEKKDKEKKDKEKKDEEAEEKENEEEKEEEKEEKENKENEEQEMCREYTALGSAELERKGEPDGGAWNVEVEISAQFCEEKAVVSTKVWYGEYEYVFSSEVVLEK